MASDGGDPRDPFRVGGPVPPGSPPADVPHGQPGGPAGPGRPGQPDRRATGTRLAILAVASLVTAVLFPPVGLALGILTIVAAVRSGERVGATGRLAAVAAASAALVVSVAVIAVGLLFATEIGQYSRCLQGANTRLAQQACQDEFSDAVLSRLGG